MENAIGVSVVVGLAFLLGVVLVRMGVGRESEE